MIAVEGPFMHLPQQTSSWPGQCSAMPAKTCVWATAEPRPADFSSEEKKTVMLHDEVERGERAR